MSRYSIDCREHPGAGKCTLAFSADSKEELLEAAVLHACNVHGYADSPEARQQISSIIRSV